MIETFAGRTIRPGSGEALCPNRSLDAVQGYAVRLFSLESQLALGEALIRLGQLEEAANILDEAAADHPTRIGPLIVLARALHRAQDFESAERRWRAVLDREPQSFEGLWRLGDIALRRGELAEAEQLLGRAEAVNPTHEGLQLSLGRLATAAERYEEARSRWASVLERNPHSNEAHLRLAEAAIRLGEWNEAAGHLTAAEELRPDSAEGRMLKARLATAAAEWESAAALWQGIAAGNPASFEAWFRLGEAHQRLGDAAAAERALEKAAALQPPGRTGVQVLLARAATNAREWELAAKRWAEVVEASPGSFEANLRLGDAAAKLGRVEEAERALRAAVAAKPDEGSALRQLGSLLQGQDRWAEAADLWKQFLARSPRGFEGWLGLATACVELRRDAEAEVALAIARTLRPLNRQPQRVYRRMLQLARRETIDLKGALAEAQAQEDAGEYERAAAIYRELLRQSRRSPAVLRRLGRLHSRRKRWTEAELVWRSLTQLRPSDPDPWRKLAQALVHLGRQSEADAAYQRIAQLDPAAAVPTTAMARRARRAQDWAEAATLWRRVVETNEESFEGWLGLGEALLHTGKALEAEAALQRAAGLDPENAAPLFLLDKAAAALESHYGESQDLTEQADAALRANDLEAAEAAYAEAVSKDPENLAAREGLARVFLRRERWADALAQWEEIARQHPQAPVPLLWSARLLGRLGRFQEGADLLQRARQLVPHSAAEHFSYARSARATEFLSEAETFFRSAIALAPEKADYPFMLSRHYLELGYIDRAYAMLSEARKAFPEHLRIAQELANTVRIGQVFGIDPTSPDMRLPERAVERIVGIAAANPSRHGYDPVPRRVVHVTSSLAGGGGERQLINSLNGLGRRLSEVESVTLLCEGLSPNPDRNFYLPRIDQSRVAVRDFGEGEVESLAEFPALQPYVAFLEHAIPRRRRSAIARLALRFLELRPAVVHGWQDETSVKVALAGVIAGVPRIVIRLGSLRPGKLRERSERSRENLRPLREIYRALLTLPQVHMLNNSRAGADDYAEWLEVPPERIEVLYNGIDFNEFEASEGATTACRASLGLAPDTPVVGGVFRLIDEKQPLLWLEAAAGVAAANPNAAFVIAGDGPLRDLVRSRAAELGIADRLHLLGRIGNVADWVGAMDVMLLTSKVEGLPNVLLEAQAAGVPVVSCPAGGAAETFAPGKTGWLVEDPTGAALAERLLWVLGQPAWRKAASDKARRFARRRFGVDHMVENTLAVYGWQAQDHKAA